MLTNNRILTVTLLLIMSALLSVYGQDKLRLGTGVIGANYYNLGHSIDSLVSTTGGESDIEVVETQASIDNLKKLRNRQLDLAIVQNDVAFNAEQKDKLFNRKHKRIRGLLSLYSEPVLIISNRQEIEFNNIVDYVVNVGQKGSGLYSTSETILGALGKKDKSQLTFQHPSKAFTQLMNHQIQVTFTNNMSNNYLQAIRDGNLFVISIDHDLIESLRSTYPYYIKDSVEILSSNITCIAVKAILICDKSLRKEEGYNLVKTIYDHYDNLRMPTRFIDKKNIFSEMSLKRWHSGALKYLKEETDEYKSNILIKIIWFVFIGLLLLIIILLTLDFFFIALQRRFKFLFARKSTTNRLIKETHLYIIRYKYLMIVLGLLTLFITNIIIVKRLEHNYAVKNNTISYFDNISLSTNVIWLLVFGVSGYEDGSFPQSPLGKLLVTMMPLLGIGGLIAIAGFITSDHIKSSLMEIKGEKAQKFKNHIIICGWNENVPFLIESLQNRNLTNFKPIVIIGACDNKKYLEEVVFPNKIISYVSGSAKDKDTLAKAGFNHAKIAIVVPETGIDEYDPDSQTILKIMAIEQYCIELENQNKRNPNQNIYTIAEIQNPLNNDLAKMAKVDEIISFEHVKSKILSTSVHNPGASKFIKEILTYDEYNDIYNIYLTKGSKLIGRNFDSILHELRKYNVLLLSINLENHRTEDEANSIIASHNLKRGIITNPLSDEEINYKVSYGDVLIVLAQNEQIIDKVTKVMSKVF